MTSLILGRGGKWRGRQWRGGVRGRAGEKGKGRGKRWREGVKGESNEREAGRVGEGRGVSNVQRVGGGAGETSLEGRGVQREE